MSSKGLLKQIRCQITDMITSGNMAKSAESALTPEERIMLLSDAWSSMRVGRDSIGDYLALAEGLQADRNRAVLETLLDQLEYVGRHLANDNDSDREKFQAWLRQLLAPAVRDLGWQPKPGESDEQRRVCERSCSWSWVKPEKIQRPSKLRKG